VVAPLGTVALVSNAIIAPFALKEKFRPQDLAGIVFAIGGAILVVCFPSKIPFFFPFSLSQQPNWFAGYLLSLHRGGVHCRAAGRGPGRDQIHCLRVLDVCWPGGAAFPLPEVRQEVPCH